MMRIVKSAVVGATIVVAATFAAPMGFAIADPDDSEKGGSYGLQSSHRKGLKFQPKTRASTWGPGQFGAVHDYTDWLPD
ncbi:MAG: hypothetical protein K0U78_03755 [Actinomycetia bacterium]|nr:hypothetical protein [Actinomycetes bacterium]